MNNPRVKECKRIADEIPGEPLALLETLADKGLWEPELCGIAHISHYDIGANLAGTIHYSVTDPRNFHVKSCNRCYNVHNRLVLLTTICAINKWDASKRLRLLNIVREIADSRGLTNHRLAWLKIQFLTVDSPITEDWVLPSELLKANIRLEDIEVGNTKFLFMCLMPSGIYV
jgi:hypothetical protein